MKMIKNISKDICMTLFLTASVHVLCFATDPGSLEAINSASPDRRNIIGIEISTATDEQKKAMGCTEGGVYVSAVIAGHPASNAGLKYGDIISEVHSTPVKEISEFLMALNDLEAGRKYPFKVCRKTQKRIEILEINILIEKVQEKVIGKIS
jgi:S1-C subfamily serine protease